MNDLAVSMRTGKLTSWVSEIVSAFRALGGAARYDDLYEYIERTTDRNLTTEWKATVRRTIEDHSSDSKNFRAEDLFRHIDHGFWCLREAGDVSALVNRRLSLRPKAVVDEVLEGARPIDPEPNLVFVREHWRRWPSPTEADRTSVALDDSIFAIVDGWVTDRHFRAETRERTRSEGTVKLVPGARVGGQKATVAC